MNPILHQIASLLDWDKVLAWLVLFFLALLFYYILDRYIRIHPKVFASINWGGQLQKWQSGVGQSYDQIAMTWRRQLVLQNNTKQDAIDVNLIWPENKPVFPITIEPHTTIRGFNKLEIAFTVNKVFLRTTVEATNDRGRDLLPAQLKWAQFAVSYSNEKGKQFYTRFTFEDGKEPLNSFHRKIPKLEPLGNGS